MSESIEERRGPKIHIIEIGEKEAAVIMAGGMEVPKLYVQQNGEGALPNYYCEPAELSRWRMTRLDSQAAGVQGG